MAAPSRNQSRRSRPASVLLQYLPQLLKPGMIFLAGLILGYTMGSSSPEFPASYSTLSVNDQGSTEPTSATSSGWNNVDVFYGSTNIVASLLPEGQQWFSQVRQDEAVFTFLKQKRNGFFIDLAANDATVLSNTYSLERDHGWRGLCIEPNPMYWYNLTHYRPNCQIVGAVVGQQRMETVHFHYEAGDHGGIAGANFDNGERFRSQSRQVYTVTLLEIFQRYKVPKVIDYLSLDVEGAEGFIMQNFPLHEYKIRLLTIERPKDDLRSLLDSHGYVQIQRMSRWGELLFTHKDIQPELDLTLIDEFHGKKQYLAQKARQEEKERSEQLSGTLAN